MRKNAYLLAAIFVTSIGLQACTTQQRDTSSYSTVSSSVIEVSSPWIDLEGVQNTRQIGGYPTQNYTVVNPDIILRSGELAGLTDTSMELLTAEYQLAHIIDLRDEVEVENAPDPVIEGVQYHHLNVWPRAVRLRIIDESTINGQLDSELYIKNYYTAFALEPTAIEAYRKMFGTLLENESGGIIIHCAHGKDRTGIAIALILSALDVEWDVIEQEYLLSNIAIPGSVDISSLRYYRSVLEEKYGSMDSYLRTEMGLDGNSLMVLREKYCSLIGAG